MWQVTPTLQWGRLLICVYTIYGSKFPWLVCTQVTDRARCTHDFNSVLIVLHLSRMSPPHCWCSLYSWGMVLMKTWVLLFAQILSDRNIGKNTEFCPSRSQGHYHQVFLYWLLSHCPAMSWYFSVLHPNYMPCSRVYCSMVLFKFVHVINLMLLQLNCVLDSYAKDSTGNTFPKFSAKDYSSIYNALLVLIEETLKHAYHGARLAEQLGSWVHEGWWVNMSKFVPLITMLPSGQRCNRWTLRWEGMIISRLC